MRCGIRLSITQHATRDTVHSTPRITQHTSLNTQLAKRRAINAFIILHALLNTQTRNKFIRQISILTNWNEQSRVILTVCTLGLLGMKHHKRARDHHCHSCTQRANCGCVRSIAAQNPEKCSKIALHYKMPRGNFSLFRKTKLLQTETPSSHVFGGANDIWDERCDTLKHEYDL